MDSMLNGNGIINGINGMNGMACGAMGPPGANGLQPPAYRTPPILGQPHTSHMLHMAHMENG